MSLNNAIWTTREGHQVEIRKMASSHLLATIHMIERKRYEQILEAAHREAEEPDMDFSNPTLQYYTQWPVQYELLVQEAQRRHLIYRGATNTETGVVKARNRSVMK